MESRITVVCPDCKRHTWIDVALPDTTVGGGVEKILCDYCEKQMGQRGSWTAAKGTIEEFTFQARTMLRVVWPTEAEEKETCSPSR